MEPRKPIGPMHDFARGRAESPRPKIRSRASSKAGPRSRPHSPDSSHSEVDEPPQPRSRRGSVHSRAGSTRSRKRSDSQTTTGSVVDAAREKKEKEEKKRGGWSVWSRSGTKKDREQFTSLRDNPDGDSDSSDPEGGSPAQVSKSSSLLSLGKWSKSQQNIASPRIPALGSRARGGEQERQKVVRAVNDYFGSTDELSFRTGDEIVVIGEVIDGWMMGQLGDKKGLFPTVYTESTTVSSRRTVSTTTATPTPPLLHRKSSSRAGSDLKTESLSGSRQTLVDTDSPPPARLGFRAEHDDDVAHPFGDHHATTDDTVRERRESASLIGGYGYGYDSESLAESAADESEHEDSSLVRRRASDDDESINHWRNNKNDNSTSTSTTSTSSGPLKKVPPPLPRRQTEVRKAPPPPPPPRRPDVRSSPQPPTYALRDGQTGDCVSFVQAVGRATGMCANCQRMHIE
jgi:Variant SH3 domain